jgi:hypothetical protein
VQKLDSFAESGEIAKMEALCTSLTFHIVGQVVTDTDSNTQDNTAQDDTTQVDETFKSFCSPMSTYSNGGLVSMGLDLPIKVKRAIRSHRFDTAIKKVCRRSLRRLKQYEMRRRKRQRTDLFSLSRCRT